MLHLRNNFLQSTILLLCGNKDRIVAKPTGMEGTVELNSQTRLRTVVIDWGLNWT